jgi:hypothetical protein
MPAVLRDALTRAPYYRSLGANAFNGNLNAIPASARGGAIAPNRDFAWISPMDLIWHF